MRAVWWVWAIAALLAAAYAVPYTVLTGVEQWAGSFLFWTAFGIAVWAVLIAAVGRWNTRDGVLDDGACDAGPRDEGAEAGEVPR